MTLKYNVWPKKKTIGHFFYNTSNFVHHFKTIREFKLELQSRYAQFGSKLAIFFVPCDLEIWWMTLKNNSQFMNFRTSPTTRLFVQKPFQQIKHCDFYSCTSMMWHYYTPTVSFHRLENNQCKCHISTIDFTHASHMYVRLPQWCPRHQ